MTKIGNDWDELLKKEFSKEYFQEIKKTLEQEYKSQEIYPPRELLFEALKRTPFEKTRVVILGQDPYHGPGQSHGLAFSVQRGIPIPPSLRNIYKELYAEMGFEPPSHGDLSSWADQGVLLLNTTLSVRRAQAGSHSQLGWKKFTGKILEILGESDLPRVFILWGNHARSRKNKIKKDCHLILEGPHPSPLSAYR
ncbi:MAG TPA: uracil-DNA glycosylase, partial [Clostridia bacterium]|nr:uracil-DNA glycosylase [Clostridia bacterium]